MSESDFTEQPPFAESKQAIEKALYAMVDTFATEAEVLFRAGKYVWGGTLGKENVPTKGMIIDHCNDAIKQIVADNGNTITGDFGRILVGIKWNGFDCAWECGIEFHTGNEEWIYP